MVIFISQGKLSWKNIFIKVTNNLIEIRTFERGVEDETLSCGTGVTAAAIVAHAAQNKEPGEHLYNIQSQGGKLTVKFQYTDNVYSNVWLIGPAKKVFTGEI